MREQIQSWLQSGGLPPWIAPTYWFMLTLAIVVASLMTLFFWKKKGPGDDTASDLIFWGIPSLLLGARFVSWLQFGFPSSLGEVWQGPGLALYGGLSGLLLAWSIYYLIRPYPILEFLDCVALSLALGLFLGRIGCFMAGCDGGIPSTLPWAVQFPPGTSAYTAQLESGWIPSGAELSLAAHPTQIYESLFGLAAFFALLLLSRNRQRSGEVFFYGMLWYGAFRLASEPLRAASGGWHPASWMTFAQALSCVLIAGSLIGLRLTRPTVFVAEEKERI